MSYLLTKATELANKAHAGQKDKAGKEYIGHVNRVADGCVTPDAKIVAMLHDIVEDTSYTLDDLRKEGFPEHIVNAVDCITKRKGNETYDNYLFRCKSNPLSREVKLSDLKDNMDLTRLSNITKKDMDRFKKYYRAKQYLES